MVIAIHYGQLSFANVRDSNTTKWENFEIFENFEIYYFKEYLINLH